MSILYICRHCRSHVGQIDRDTVDEARLGFQFLTPGERRDIISYNPDGNVIVKVTCDYCREALEANPELSLLSNPLQ
ncbi:Protein of uncharacterised function (DUF2757) [Chlamydia abortus]|uniref:Anti-sigma-F factor Fin n=1 Tax=Paenibacillus residui TaxID=629724 RepID=A0ABW3D9H1_9BACL|nr:MULTISPECIES: anti-sigma-F factor Fin family protein [Paenibacillaceae]SHE13769.1 Protein of uncharacterised function (DUF2757) [Chlamydia abortus]